jgi:hypothetical protein
LHLISHSLGNELAYIAEAIGARTRVQSHAFICELVTIGADCSSASDPKMPGHSRLPAERWSHSIGDPKPREYCALCCASALRSTGKSGVAISPWQL